MQKLLLIMGMAMCVTLGHAQNDNSGLSAFRKSIRENFENFRKSINEEFADFLRDPWKEFKEEQPVPRPKDEKVPPVVISENDPVPQPIQQPVPFDEVITNPAPKPQPQPVEPIKEMINPLGKPEPTVVFHFFGTEGSVRIDGTKLEHVKGTDENSIADIWISLSKGVCNNLIRDCLDLRKRYSLCDWAYLQMLKQMSTKVCDGWNNDATLLTAFVFCQSGYKVRLASARDRLYMMFASEHSIYDIPYYSLPDGDFYPFGECPDAMRICEAKFPNEKSLSLWVSTEQKLAVSATNSCQRTSKRYNEINVSYVSNKNLMDFYSTYPTSMVGDNVVSRWAMYANTPMSTDIRQQLYPQLKSFIEGMSQLDAVNRLLNWVQTGFVYKYDDEVWGDDRAFFAEESLFYPYCDCEDRSILFTRIVRDLLGLKCILVYYPNHLAAAVNFSETVNGDYILLDGKHFVVCDPTYIGASVGCTMPKMDNAKAKVILLR